MQECEAHGPAAPVAGRLVVAELEEHESARASRSRLGMSLPLTWDLVRRSQSKPSTTRLPGNQLHRSCHTTIRRIRAARERSPASPQRRRHRDGRAPTATPGHAPRRSKKAVPERLPESPVEAFAQASCVEIYTRAPAKQSSSRDTAHCAYGRACFKGAATSAFSGYA